MPDLRALTRTVTPELDVLFCRGADVSAIISAGAAEIGLAGCDVESTCSGCADRTMTWPVTLSALCSTRGECRSTARTSWSAHCW
ncbi:hypothetical protein ACFOWZ_43600 [Lentzea rhizosphaerae]|uniref:Uncharacterized protein n=1 Tax=Lentzea rhizosphaerae TaxID=2041025 RepID=A0ABV8C8S3_9PSEU